MKETEGHILLAILKCGACYSTAALVLFSSLEPIPCPNHHETIELQKNIHSTKTDEKR